MNLTLKLMIFFFLFTYIQSKSNPLNINTKDINKTKSKKDKNGKKQKIKTRKMQGDGDGGDEEEPHYFANLTIFPDTNNLEDTFPYDKEKYLGIFINAINNTKEKIEKFIEIEIDYEAQILNYDVNGLKEDWGINSLDENLFGDGSKEVPLTYYNYFLFFRFSNLNIDATSNIVYTYLAYEIPLIGIITFHNVMEESKLNLEYLTNLILHEMIHLLGFHIDDDQFTFSCIIESEEETEEGEETKTIYYVSNRKAPGVINYAQKYFNCSDISTIELELDEYQNIHWPKRYFLGDIMTVFDYPEEQVISGFTLAFLNDLPYINVIQSYTGGLMKFGRHKGCDFLKKKCGEDLGDQLTFSNEFFLPININELPANFEPSCSSGRLSKTVYKLYEKEPEPEGNEYYQNGITGKDSVNYCPISEFNERSSTYIYSGHCNTPPNTPLEGEIFSPTSFCVLSSLVESNTIEPQMNSFCYNMSCSSMSLTIQIGDNYIVCPREGGQIKVKGFNGYLLCPDYNLICSGTELCNNLLDCIEKGSKDQDFDYDYEIKTTQNSSVYNKNNPEISYGWELTNEGVCHYLCSQCTSYTNCILCAPHFNPVGGKCVYIIEHCIKFEDEENDVCTKCNETYFLVENSDGKRYCETGDIGKYYKIVDNEDLQLYKKCEIENCNTCVYNEDSESKVKCSSCSSPFEVIDDGSFCGNPSTKLYYEDSSGVFKSCTKHEPANTCSKCEKTGDTFTCLECTSNYVLYHGNNPATCLDKIDIDDTMFTNDNKNYYPCHNREYHDIGSCIKCNKKDECNLCSSEYTLANGTKTCLLTSLIDDKKYYKNPNNNYYYKCPDSCSTCESATKCLTCATSYLLDESDICFESSLFETDKFYYYNDALDKYSKCSNIQNCQKCLSSTECIGCINNYYLVKGRDDLLSCQNIDISKYYPTIEGTKTYYKKCEDAIQNCEECSASNKCTKCKTNFGIVDNDHTQCVDISNEKYYYDTTLETFKLCGNKMTNCEYCSTYGDFTCKKCFSSYSFKHDNSITCEEKTTLEGNNYFYTNDSKINYYSCRLFHDALNCEKCASKEICEECQRGYDLYNNKRLCAKQGDIDNNIFTWTNDDILVLCSSAIKDCERCNDTATCYSCQDEAGLIDNDTCVNKTILEQNKNHYYDEKSKRYISCSVMDNCITCDSSTVCTSCQAGFVLSGNLCSNADDGDDGLSTGAIIGIVFGCIGFLLLVAGIAFFLITKIFKKNNNNVIQMDANNKVEIQEEKGVEKEKVNEVVLHKAKRSIHNV